MRLEKLFKVLLVGGSALTAGCGSDGAQTGQAPDVAVAVTVRDAGADVSRAKADAPAADVADASADAGVFAWLSWV